MTWGIIIANRASRDLQTLDHETRNLIDATFDAMSTNPYDWDIKFLRGTGGIIRRRAGAWRILFEAHQGEYFIIVLAVKRRASNTY